MTSSDEDCVTGDCLFLVAGANGFIGRMFVEKALSDGASVVGFDIAAGAPPQSPCASRHEVFAGAFADVRPRLLLAARSSLAKRVVAVNFAGIASVAACERDPARAYEANVHLAVEFARLADEAGARTCVFPSTSAVYGDSNPRACSEGDPVTVPGVYVATKLAAEHLLSDMSRDMSCDVAVVRPSNVYGPGSSTDSVFGLVLKQVRERETIRVRSFGPVRDFLHVEDLVAAMMHLALAKATSRFEVYNVSTGVPTSIGELVRLASGCAGLPYEEAGNEGSASRLVVDNTKIRRTVSWEPRVALARGIETICGGMNNG